MERLTERMENAPDGESNVWVKNHDYIKASEKLAEYEDLEEQGLLVRLPIALGSDVYFITVNNEIIHGICLDISLSDKQFYCQLGKWLKFSDIGQKVFRTRKEAEKKLEEMKNE